MIDFHNYDLNAEIEKIKNHTSAEDIQHLYSNYKIIKELYNIPKDYQLNYYQYHGIYLEECEMSNNAFKFNDKVILCTRKSQVDYLLNQPNYKNQNTFHTGGLFPRYRRLKNITKSPEAKGTIAFYNHSIAECKVQTDIPLYIKKLKELPEQFHPINICMFWVDLLANSHLPFLENGFNVYTAGTDGDEDFVDNFYEILRHHEYATGNSSSTSSYFYAVELGIPLFRYDISYCDKSKVYKSIQHLLSVSEAEYTNIVNNHIEIANTLFPTYPNIATGEENRNKVLYYLGLDQEIPDKAIRKALLKTAVKPSLIKKIKRFFLTRKKEGTKREIIFFNFLHIHYNVKE